VKAYRWKKDRKINAPGAYVGLPIDVYHGDPVEGRFVTASSLKRAARSPAHFWAQCAWNPDREPPDVDTDALRLGKAGHIAAFQPELFDEQFVVSPYEAYRTNEAKAWKEATLAEGKLPIKQAELDTIVRMAAALRADPEARELFKDSLPEMTFVTRDEATGLWMLSRPDSTPSSNARGLVDYKTSANGAWEAYGRAAYDYGYDIQTVLALDNVAEVTGELRPCMWHVVQEKEPPFVVSVHRWEPDQIMFARRKVRDLLDRIASCIETGEWPGYGPAQRLVTPYYVQRQMDQERNDAA